MLGALNYNKQNMDLYWQMSGQIPIKRSHLTWVYTLIVFQRYVINFDIDKIADYHIEHVYSCSL